jgi:hypothetical protein
MAKDYFKEAIMTPECRVAFVKVFEVNDNGKYSIAMLFDKETTDLKPIKQACKELALEYFDVSSIKELPDKFKWPWKDGDKPNSEGNTFDGYPGCWVINATTGEDRQPGVVGPRPLVPGGELPRLGRNEFYSGCYARVKITPFAYNNKGKGISFFLGNIQKIRDGEPFGAFSDPNKDFTAMEPSGDDITATDDDF